MNNLILRIFILLLLIFSPIVVSAKMCPDGSYVNGSKCKLCPDGSYSGGNCRLQPDGSYK